MKHPSLSAKQEHILHGMRAFVGVGLLAPLFMSGCGLANSGMSAGPIASASAGAPAQGRVMGGQQPVSGATIQLYTVGTTAIGAASTPLLTLSATTSDGTGVGGNASNGYNSMPAGDFTITGDYSCFSATQVYITATGGNAGGGNNTALGLMAALGPCSALPSVAFLNINELTTVAAVYALAPFMTDYKHIGAAGSNPSGLVNAFNMASTLVNFQTGTIATPSSGVGLPSTRINTLADLIAACVNSTSAAASPACTTMLSASGAAETIGVALAMAKSPAAPAILALYGLLPAAPPFLPALTTQPTDFTLVVNYTGSEVASPGGVAIDASGNAWVTNEAGFSVIKMPSVSKSFTTTTYSSGGLLAPRGISIDRTGNVWIANSGANSVVELSSSGAVLSGAGFTGGGMSNPVAIANDSNGNAWVANFSGNSITELNAGGVASGASPITGSSALSVPAGIAIDSSGDVAVANAGTGQLCLFSNAAVLQSCVSDAYLLGSRGVAVSKSGSIAMAGTTTGTAVTGAFTLATTSAVNAASPVTGGGLLLPSAVAFDGNGIAWFTNTTSLSAFAGSSAVSPTSGYGVLNAPVAIAIDPSGNIWTANSGDSSVSVFVGLAVPVTTPLAANVGP